MKSGSTIVDMSTNSPTVVRGLAEKTKAKGVHFLDAPVSGGVRGARNATLAIMAEGRKRFTTNVNLYSKRWAQMFSIVEISVLVTS